MRAIAGLLLTTAAAALAAQAHAQTLTAAPNAGGAPLAASDFTPPRFGPAIAPIADGRVDIGAVVRLDTGLEDQVMRRLGVAPAETPPNPGRGRWYVFAAASGRAVGLDMQPANADQRVGWSNGPTSALISDAQAGLGWSRGGVEASLGYVHRAVTSQSPILSGPQSGGYHDSMVAFSFSIVPR
jgi:hypothetical protein